MRYETAETVFGPKRTTLLNGLAIPLADDDDEAGSVPVPLKNNFEPGAAPPPRPPKKNGDDASPPRPIKLVAESRNGNGRDMPLKPTGGRNTDTIRRSGFSIPVEDEMDSTTETSFSLSGFNIPIVDEEQAAPAAPRSKKPNGKASASSSSASSDMPPRPPKGQNGHGSNAAVIQGFSIPLE